jgi:hypothetical protein
MKKLKLEMDELRVESFDAGSAGSRGTVAAREWSGVDDGCAPYAETTGPFGFCNPRDCGSGESCTLDWAACNCLVPGVETGECA